MAEELKTVSIPITDGTITKYEDTYILSEFNLVHGGSGNATVPNDAFILPEQAFVDTLYHLFSNIVTLDGVQMLSGFTGRADITSLSFPKVAHITGDLNLNDCTSLSSISFPLLQNVAVGGFLNANNNALISASFPALNTVAGQFTLSNCPLLTSVLFPLLASVSGELDINDGPLTNISFPSLTSVTGVIFVGNCFLNTAAVDSLFNALANTVVTGGGSIEVDGMTPPAPPTSASQTARDYLTGLGITISTD